jgi:purine-nucleoside phosphorylase
VSHYEEVEEACRFLAARMPAPPDVGVVLGSGLDSLASELVEPMAVPYQEIPHWPRSTVAGHAGRLVAGRLGDKTVAVLSGRAHLYEGHPARAVVFSTRVLGRLGIRTLILTNAAGGVNPALRAGQLVLLADHINLLGTSPLFGETDERFGPRFVDLTEVYPARLRELARACGRELGIDLAEGVYAALHGPNYETPAEVRYLRAIGADMVGMSTAPEAIAAAQMGIPVLGISCIANAAAGVSTQKISHEDVLATGARAGQSLSALLQGVIAKL